MSQVELKVEEEGRVILRYTFPYLRDATEQFVYLRDFFPQSTFIIQPLRH